MPCQLCHIEKVAFRLATGELICEKCRTKDYPYVQFCDLCKREIRQSIIDRTGNDLYTAEIVVFDAKAPLGRHYRTRIWCEDCLDEIEYLRITDLETELCGCGKRIAPHPFSHPEYCEDCAYEIDNKHNEHNDEVV